MDRIARLGMRYEIARRRPSRMASGTNRRLGWLRAAETRRGVASHDTALVTGQFARGHLRDARGFVRLGRFHGLVDTIITGLLHCIRSETLLELGICHRPVGRDRA